MSSLLVRTLDMVRALASAAILALGLVLMAASTATATPSVYTYGTDAYSYDGSPPLSLQSVATRDVRGSPAGPVAASWGRSASDLGCGVAANAGARLEIQLGTKIEGQLGKRGWTPESVEDLIINPSRTVATRDTRYLPGGGRNDAPATGYINRTGGYVVRNDETGDIVQVSNLNDPNWKSPW